MQESSSNIEHIKNLSEEDIQESIDNSKKGCNWDEKSFSDLVWENN